MTYYTHWNGERPFKVAINGNSVSISEIDYDDCLVDSDDENNNFDESEIYNYTHVVSYKNCGRIFIGNEQDEVGNTVIFEIAPLKYVCVWSSVFEFTTIEQVEKYSSKIMDNDIPFPYAITENYVYLIEPEKNTVVVPRKSMALED